jgi:hypothetical protein
MKKTLHANNFELCYLDGNTYKYFSYRGADYEITIEPNGIGYDVAHYDHNGFKCGDRIQVRPVSSDLLPHDTFLRAVAIANGVNTIVHARKELQTA